MSEWWWPGGQIVIDYCVFLNDRTVILVLAHLNGWLPLVWVVGVNVMFFWEMGGRIKMNLMPRQFYFSQPDWLLFFLG